MYSKEELETAARSLDLPVAMVKAVMEVESNGKGFVGKEPVILFESHYFGKLTNNVHDARYPNLSGKSWDRTKYSGSNAGEHKRLQKAVALDRDAALKSASWGAFQILGANYQSMGYGTIQDFINDAYTADGQLRMFVKFIQARRLDRYLRRMEFDKFAEVYNGPAYKKNNYACKIRDAFLRNVAKEKCA